MREVVGENQIDRILTQDREPIQIQVRELMQKTLDSYGAGVTITRVQMQKVDPPAEVIAAYRDVQAARADQERMRNEAEAYANKIIPEGARPGGTHRPGRGSLSPAGDRRGHRPGQAVPFGLCRIPQGARRDAQAHVSRDA